jgi:thiamine-monophosphate kinase
MDVSDGLVQDLGHIATASGVAIRVEASQVPVSEDLRTLFAEDALTMALTGGEDYELILIGPDDVMSKYVGETEKQVTVVGRVEAAGKAGITVVDERGRPMKFEHKGWDHLAGL